MRQDVDKNRCDKDGRLHEPRSATNEKKRTFGTFLLYAIGFLGAVFVIATCIGYVVLVLKDRHRQ